MPVLHYIAMDTHSYTTDICVKTRANGPGRKWHVATTIPAIREVIESIKRPRHLTFEEGPLAAWLYRNLKDAADRTLVCDPRKNAWISRGGDKSDPIDAGKLADLLAGGFLKAVHQSEDPWRSHNGSEPRHHQADASIQDAPGKSAKANNKTPREVQPTTIAASAEILS